MRHLPTSLWCREQTSYAILSRITTELLIVAVTGNQSKWKIPITLLYMRVREKNRSPKLIATVISIEAIWRWKYRFFQLHCVIATMDSVCLLVGFLLLVSAPVSPVFLPSIIPKTTTLYSNSNSVFFFFRFDVKKIMKICFFALYLSKFISLEARIFFSLFLSI